MKLGVISDCFKRPMAESIALAGALGLDGIQMYAVGGDICPDALLSNEEKLNEYKALLKNLGIEDEYEGIANCTLGYPAWDELPAPLSRNDGRVFYI